MIFPTTTVADFTSAVTGVITTNIGVVLGILAFMFSIKWILHLFNKSTRAHL